MRCIDCIYCEKCAKDNLLTQFSKDNIAYCEKFLQNKQGEQKMKEIERAIERLSAMPLDFVDLLNYEDEIQLAIQALQSELDRQENKPLELSELKNMVGEPAYLVIEPYHTKETSKNHKNQYVIIVKDESNNIYAKGATGKFDLGSFKYYKNKPSEVTNEKN